MIITTLAQAVNARVLAAPAVPNPAPQAPPGLQGAGDSIIGWFKYGGIIAGVLGLIICGVQMSLGRRNRSEMAAQGATGLPWVGGGLLIIGASSAIVSGLLG